MDKHPGYGSTSVLDIPYPYPIVNSGDRPVVFSGLAACLARGGMFAGETAVVLCPLIPKNRELRCSPVLFEKNVRQITRSETNPV